MSSLLEVKVDSQLDDLFKHSAGKSELAIKAVDPKQLDNKIKRKKHAEVKKGLHKLQDGIKRAQELAKRKAGDISDDEDTKQTKKIKKLTAEEKAEKESRTIFIGNLPVDCIEKDGQKQLQKKFKEFGEIESIRFRSVAFTSPMDRKAAFLSRKIHTDRDAVNAYIVFKDASSVEKASKCNGLVFMEKHLRVDAANNSKQHDRKRSVFLGALPFDIDDEELWTFFKDCGEIDSVRVVRDQKTNVGKGFGYVQFKTRDCVDLALALSDKKLRDKTTIRISRCKIPRSEGGVESKKHPKKHSKPLSKAKMFEGTRAVKDDKKKFKLVKRSKKAKK
ncbi:hypothetical protein BDB01DRAFT_787589 [Pilobolus umbonatus]|nr:hypothetical protein BDB01DRAFT_787589 [Pilobolus umbonatus]